MLLLDSAGTQTRHMIDVKLVDYLTLALEVAKVTIILVEAEIVQEYAETVVAAVGAAVQA